MAQAKPSTGGVRGRGAGVLLRPALAKDLAEINEIYNYSVRHSTCTYQLKPDTLAQRRAWFRAHDTQHPVIVAVCGGVVGWGALSKFHPRAAYRFTAEDSIYVRHDRQRRGIGRALLEELLVRGRRAGLHSVLAVIDAEQTHSMALHRRLGFVEAGKIREVGWKQERWLDVVYLQRML